MGTGEILPIPTSSVEYFNTVLSELRQLLNSKGYKGETVLKEFDGSIVLENWDFEFIIYHSGYKYTRGKSIVIGIHELNSVVRRAVELLHGSELIPVKYNRIYFDVSDKDLSYGVYYNDNKGKWLANFNLK